MNLESESADIVVERLREELERERVARRRIEADLAMARETVRTLALSETYFRHLTEYALDLITILDADGTIRFESRSIARELGHPPAHYRGRCAFEFVHPEDLPAVAAAFGEALHKRGNTP